MIRVRFEMSGYSLRKAENVSCGVLENSLYRSDRPILKYPALQLWERESPCIQNRALSTTKWSIQPGTSSFQTHPRFSVFFNIPIDFSQARRQAISQARRQARRKEERVPFSY